MSNEEPKTELIAKDISYIQRDISEIKSSIKELAGVYATKVQLDEFSKDLKERLRRLESSANLWKWLGPAISGIFCTVITFLVINYLQNLK